ncbi:MAG: amidohydrolase family protein [Armatimonadetes bacterium]|nr:amidohydrolase family protein [Armatimonadota bacterium]
MTDLSRHIQATPLADTHEHLGKEKDYLEGEPDVLQDIFGNYVTSDLAVAGAAPEAVQRLTDSKDPDIAGRFRGIQDAWERCRFTGYGEASRLIARHAYGIEEITPECLAAAQARKQPPRPGDRLRILKDIANLDHVQVDDFCWPCRPDESGPGFFFYDISWAGFSNGDFGPRDAEAIRQEAGVEVRDIASLREAIAGLFARYAPCAIAVKSQHAYSRTLRWEEREDGEAEKVLIKRLNGEDVTESERLCLGDWCWARGVEMTIDHDIPFKLHTGYYAGYGRMPMDYIRCGNLSSLLARYPQARFVLMHISYPYNPELVALAKHYPNVYADMCWAWSIDPYSACDFVRRIIHTAPSNKLFVFGGDTFWPNASVAYAMQARHWLTRALQGEVDDGLLTETEAMSLATHLMIRNQEECFRLPEKRAYNIEQAGRP